MMLRFVAFLMFLSCGAKAISSSTSDLHSHLTSETRGFSNPSNGRTQEFLGKISISSKLRFFLNQKAPHLLIPFNYREITWKHGEESWEKRKRGIWDFKKNTERKRSLWRRKYESSSSSLSELCFFVTKSPSILGLHIIPFCQLGFHLPLILEEHVS